jgi:formylglycine-generating enzyme required for sulfatase activity
MKKTTLFPFAATLSLLIASCGGPQDQSTSSSPPAITPTSSEKTAAVPAATLAPLPISTLATRSVPRAPWGDVGKIAFTRIDDENYEIYVMDPDGGNPVNLTHHAGFDAGPSWSPDGQRVAFYSKRDGNMEIYVMDADGGRPTNLTQNEAMDMGPAWAPDGEHIAFSSNRTGNSDIYIMEADGANPVNLTNHWAEDSGPAWSPDGKQIAFASNRDGNWEIYTMEVGGGAALNRTQNEADDFNPAWSPDGQFIAFQSARDGNILDRIKEIYLMGSAGENPVRLTQDGHSADYPTWAPDGQWIIYSYGQEGQRELRAISISGDEKYTVGKAWGGGFLTGWWWPSTSETAVIVLPTPAPTKVAGGSNAEPETAMIRVRSGTYSIGGNPAEALEICRIFRDDCQIEWFLDEAPEHEVVLDEYFIDPYEATNADYARCVEAGACAPPDRTSSATRDAYYGNPRYADYPVIYVSWEDADRYCAWRGARLPTEAEWEAAARGGLAGNPFPWGIELPICESGTMWGAKFDDSMACDDTDTEAVGSFFPNFLGIYDMAGNVMEWTADWFDVYPGGDPGISNDFGEMYRVARGGSWYTFADALRVAIRFAAKPGASFNHYGFRCASSP